MDANNLFDTASLVLSCGLLALAGSGCESCDSDPEPGGWDLDTGFSDAAPEDAGGDDSTVSPDGNGTEDGNGGTPDPTCECPGDVDATCRNNPDEPCATTGDSCQIDGCPSGYTCKDSGHCVCRSNNSENCALLCDRDADCGSNNGYVCIGGKCTQKNCRSDDVCSDGRVCGSISGELFCLPPGDTSTGESCDSSSDCQTRYCLQPDGVCVDACVSNSQCASDRECVKTGSDHPTPFCREPECGDCSDNEYCVVQPSRTICLENACGDADCAC